MKFGELMLQAGIKGPEQLKSLCFEAKERFYTDGNLEETDMPIQYITLPKPVEHFDVCFLSYNAAKAISNEELKYSDLEIAFDDEAGWKAQLPAQRQASSLKFACDAW